MKNISTYKQALDAICKAHYILIVTHINPDADTISCALSLSNYFKENKIKHKVFNKMDTLPRNLDFLPLFSKITNQLPKYYDLVIYVDCGAKSRSGIVLDESIQSINIDHHQSNDNYANINIVDANKASSAEIVYDFFITNDFNISKNSAMCMYTGIYDDSIKFSTPRCDATTFETINALVKTGINTNFISDNLNRRDSLAKYRLLPKVLESLELHNEGKVATIYVKPQWLEQTGASYVECEDAIDMILNIAVVKIAIYLRVSNGKTRISLRSKDNIDVSIIAKQFNGGGHKMSAGCTYKNGNITEAKDMILEFISTLDN